MVVIDPSSYCGKPIQSPGSEELSTRLFALRRPLYVPWTTCSPSHNGIHRDLPAFIFLYMIRNGRIFEAQHTNHSDDKLRPQIPPGIFRSLYFCIWEKPHRWFKSWYDLFSMTFRHNHAFACNFETALQSQKRIT